MRCEAFKTIFTAYRDSKEKLFPLAKLVTLLGFDDEDEAYDYCNLFGLRIVDDVSVLMGSSMNVDCFKLTQTNQARLKARRSNLLVESKFEKSLDSAACQLSQEERLSEIISGQSFADGSKQASVFGIKANSAYRLHSSFNDECYYCSDEINQLLEVARQAALASSSMLPSKKPGANKILVKKLRDTEKPKSDATTTGASNLKAAAAKASTLVRRASLIKKAAAQQLTKGATKVVSPAGNFV